MLFINDKIFLLMNHKSMHPRTGRSLSSTGSDFMFDSADKRVHDILMSTGSVRSSGALKYSR